MIRLLTENKIKDFLKLCENDLTGAVITTRLNAYGLYSNGVTFWYAENENGLMTAACGMLDGVFSVCKTENADEEELRLFAETVGAAEFSVDEYKNRYILKFIKTDDNKKTVDKTAAESVTGENLKDIFPVIFESDGNRSLYFEKWYSDASHKIRHGFIHGKCVCFGGKCVSAALTSGETDILAVISSVATLENYRNRGFGADVVTALAESLDKLNKKVYLMTDDEKTMKWYLKIGFSLV